MKTVGILTVHRLPNWGSVLQAYALQQIIDSLGYHSTIIDYIYPNPYHWEKGSFKPNKISIKTRIAQFLGIRAYFKTQLLNKFLHDKMRLSKKFPTIASIHKNPPKFNIYVAGSDQIWNYKTLHCDSTFMFDFVPQDKKKIAYSSSFSVEKLSDDVKETYKTWLSKFDYLSVREQNGSKIIKELLNRDIPVVLDPTLLLDGNHWTFLSKQANVKSVPKKYILCYMLGYTYNPKPAMTRLLRRIQQKYDYPVIFIGQNIEDYDGKRFDFYKTQNLGISEFLWLIKNADIVVSSSFHGVAFSVNLGTPLIAMVESLKQADDRIKSLLENLEMMKNLYSLDTELNSFECDGSYNRDYVEQALFLLRKKSMDYLKKALS